MRAPPGHAAGGAEVSILDRKLFGRLWPFMRRQAAPLLVSLVALPLVAVLQLVQPRIIQGAIDGPITAGEPEGLLPWAGALFGALALLYTLQFIQAYAMHLAGQGIVHDLRTRAHAHLITLHDRYFRKNPTGKLLTRVTADVEGIGEMFAAGFLTLIADVVLLVGICVALLLLHTELALVTFLALPVLLGVSQFFQSRLRGAYREIRRRVAVLNGYLQEKISGIQVIQLFAREKKAYDEFEQRSRELMEENFRSIRLDATLFAVVDAMSHLTTALLIYWAASPILDEALTLELGLNAVTGIKK